jgi:lipopolysaccharide transport system ATP-binding protein
MAESIQVERLGKRYRIGKLQHETMLREALVNLFRGSLRRKKQADSTFWALQDVTFNVRVGEVVGIIGRNGAGKSTLLKLLARITQPTAGVVRARGRVASLLEVGTGFHEELSGRENIFLNGSILGMKRKEVNAKLDAIIEFAGVQRFIDTPIKRYSSGMRLRLGFAVAAHLEPDVLLVDEVLAVGDAAFQKKCLATMDELRSGGRTVLFVSHNMEAVENLCPRTIWIDSGRIRKDGASAEIIPEYLRTFAHAQQRGLDLREYEHRRGTGEARVTGVEFFTKEGEPKEIIRSGDGLLLRLHYEAEHAIVEPHFGFRLTTELGTMITDVSTWSTGLEIPQLEPGEGSIDLEIDFLNLMPGRYYLTLWIQGTGPVHYDILDNCMVFDVETTNYYRSGRGISSKFGLVFFPCRWHPPESR